MCFIHIFSFFFYQSYIFFVQNGLFFRKFRACVATWVCWFLERIYLFTKHTLHDIHILMKTHTMEQHSNRFFQLYFLKRIKLTCSASNTVDQCIFTTAFRPTTQILYLDIKIIRFLSMSTKMPSFWSIKMKVFTWFDHIYIGLVDIMKKNCLYFRQKQQKMPQ